LFIEPKYKWYYDQLRRYGKTGNDFTIESGRRSESGEGIFVFIHENPTKILKTSLSDTPRLQYYDVQTLEYRYISKLPMKNDRIWNFVILK
jgi:hypothetical protein